LPFKILTPLLLLQAGSERNNIRVPLKQQHGAKATC
jgi:hypothetical protein